MKSTGLKTRHYGLGGSPNHLCPRDIARLIEQGIHAFEESEGVGQFRVDLECGFVHPPRMNVKEPAIPDRVEDVKTQAARLVPRRPGHFAQGLLCSTPSPSRACSRTKNALLHGCLHVTASLLPATQATLAAHFGGKSKRGHEPSCPTGRRNEEPGLGPRQGRRRRDECRPAAHRRTEEPG